MSEAVKIKVKGEFNFIGVNPDNDQKSLFITLTKKDQERVQEACRKVNADLEPIKMHPIKDKEGKKVIGHGCNAKSSYDFPIMVKNDDGTVSNIKFNQMGYGSQGVAELSIKEYQFGQGRFSKKGVTAYITRIALTKWVEKVTKTNEENYEDMFADFDDLSDTSMLDDDIGF